MGSVAAATAQDAGSDAEVDSDDSDGGVVHCPVVAWSHRGISRGDEAPPPATGTALCKPPFATPCARVVHVLPAGARVFGVAVAPDGDLVATGTRDRCVRVWVPATGRCVATLEAHKGPVFDCSWSPSGSHLASCSQVSRGRGPCGMWT